MPLASDRRRRYKVFTLKQRPGGPAKVCDTLPAVSHVTRTLTYLVVSVEQRRLSIHSIDNFVRI